MANRRFEQFQYSLVKKATYLVGKAVYNATSDTFTISEAPGVSSITVNGNGDYSMLLADKYAALLMAKFTIQKASAADLVPQMVSETVATTKLVNFKALAGATATEPATGDVLYFELVLRNSSVV